MFMFGESDMFENHKCSHICLDYYVGSGLMNMFLWTVGIIFGVLQQVWFDLCFTSQILLFQEH